MATDVPIVPVAIAGPVPLVSPVLIAHELYRFYHIGDDETAALRGISLKILPGEIVVVMGPSGSGKSTLLNCLCGLDEPDAGQVWLGQSRVSRQPEAARAQLRAQSMGIILQSGNLFAHFTVSENIRFQMMLAGKVDADRLVDLIASADLTHRATAYPASLSGGETARAALALALANDPPLLIADEPTAEVDAATEGRLLDLFATRRTSGRATLIATHSAALAQRADRIIQLRDGKIIDD